MDRLGTALNRDVDVPLDGNLPRLRKVNVTLDEEAVRNERILQLKKTRGGFKSALTKKRNELSELLHREKSVDTVKIKIMELDQAFDNFKGAHDVYTKSLVEEDSIMESREYLKSEYCAVKQLKERAGARISELLFTHTPPAERDILPEDSVSQIGSAIRSRASSGRSKSSRSSNTTSSIRLKYVEEAAKRKALEAKLKVFEEQKALAEKKFQLQQQEELLRIKSDLAQTAAREQVYAEADDLECSSEFDVKPEGTFQEKKKPAVKTYDPVTSEISPESKPDLFNAVTPPSSNVETIQRVIESQERQAKCMEGLVAQQHQGALSLTLPKHEVPVFSGDPVQFCGFVKAFECLIESKTSSNSERLYYLVQYTRGEVQELMRSYLAMDPDEGYPEARKILKKRYGESYRIATAYVDRVTKGPVLKAEDSKGLQKLSTLLTSCKNTLKSIGYGSKIENPDSLRGVVERLPYDLRKRWRSTADRITEEEDREIRFDDIVAFVEKQARTASHPVFGDILSSAKDQEREKKRDRNPKFKNNSFATRVGDNNQVKGNGNSRNLPPRMTCAQNKNCVMCKKDHRLEDCPEFKSKNYDDRVQFAWSNYLCYNCLMPDHRVRECKRRVTCKDCGRKHSSLLHPPPPVRVNENQNQPAISEVSGNPPVLGPQGAVTPVSNGFIGFTGSTNPVIGFPIVPVKVKARGCLDYVVTHAFLDSGSNSTFCTKELLKQLSLEGVETSLSLSTIEKENSRLECQVVSLEVCDLQENEFVDLPTVFSTPILPVSLDDIPRQEDIAKWPHLHGICLPQVNAQVGLLIGNDNTRALEPIEIRQSGGEGPYAVRTVFGWTVNGPLGRKNDGASRTTNLIRGDVQLEKQFKKFCELEFSDSIVDDTTQMSREDLKAVEIMEQTTVLNGNHYQMALPWKLQQPSLLNNRALAEHRLKLLGKRLSRDPVLFGKYSSVIDDHLRKGYCEKVPVSSLSRADGMVWYLPHHPMLHPEKPNKTRVVFDCAAKYANTSLNDLLLQGPDFTNSLIGVLLRFRQERIALMSDVESMFHQVQVAPDHCDSLRFLWWPENDMKKEAQDYRMKVHLFGAVSSPSCAGFALRKTAKDNSTAFPLDVVETVNKNFYVDDCLKSVEDENMAIALVPKLSELLMKGGFHLTKWLCNSPRVLATIPETERAKSVKELDFEDMPTERALGVKWNLESDTFGFKVKVKDKPPTRRGMLSIVSSVYDPFGFASPFVLPAKAVLQDLCRRGLSWDEAVPEESLKRWKEWLFELPRLEEFSIERCVKPYGFGNISTCQLHHFSDASLIGYGAVTYLRLEDEGGQIHCALLMAKSRLAPLKSISIPRLELSAATVAVRLDKMIKQELELSMDKSVFWTDSTSVLKYIANSNTRFHTFVANRVSQILDGSTPTQWRHVPTKLNPADDASRGLKVDALLAATRWKIGPSFLWEQEDNWPNQSTIAEELSGDDPEVKTTTLVGAVCKKEATVEIDEVFKRFSSWHHLKKFVAWILRFKTNLHKACCQAISEPAKQKRNQPIQPISTIEMRNAELSIIKYVQKRYFKEEVESLAAIKNHEENSSSRPKPSCVKKSSSVLGLDPVLIDGILRVGGRLRRASLPQDAKHQIILLKNHHVTNLIVRHYHLMSGHSGREHVLSLLRGKFWVVHANSVVRKLLAKCFDCRRRQAPVCNQKMADLPEERVTPSQPPFSHVGIDFFGPFLVKRGRSQVKRYGCIFTCLAIRAVHIEVTHSLDTDSFLNALRRFIARRGKPVLVRTDNGSNFVSGDKEIRANIDQWNTQQIHEYLLHQDVHWMFNPPSGSHHGGIWERCIRTTRKILNALLKEQTLSDESLMTLMCEVESIINGRPITKVSPDPRDLEALTPNHLLLFRSGSVLPPGIFRKEDTFSRRRWRQVQYLADQFWRRWSREYIPLLQQRQKWNYPRRNAAVDDIVLIVDDRSPRSCWPMARVIEVMPGKDGCVRRVKVKTKTSELERPIDKCVLLEAAEEYGL